MSHRSEFNKVMEAKDHCMHPFIFHARFEAKQIFQNLDPRFSPAVHFIGLPLDPKEAIELYPTDCPFPSSLFSGVLTRAADLEASDPEAKSRWMPDPNHGWTDQHEKLQRGKVRSIRVRALRQAVIEALASPSVGIEFVHYVGWPVQLDKHEIVPVLQLQRTIHDEYYHLTQGTHTDAWGHREYRKERSLIDAVAGEYLHIIGTELIADPQGGRWSLIKDQEKLLLDAAKSLMATAALAGGNEDGLNGLFDICNNLSTLKYEGAEGRGQILFVSPDHPKLDPHILFKNPVPLRSLGAVRKLLEMSSDSLFLLCDSYEVFGLGRMQPTYSGDSEDAVTVKFSKQFSWSLYHIEKNLMHVRFGKPGIRVAGFPDDLLRELLPRVFSGIEQSRIDHLLALSKSFSAQKHGCMLVISTDAAGEAQRLIAQGTNVVPFSLDPSFIPRLTAIDGSVLVDCDGRCHAIGVILDGPASEYCSSERGSRYNSAIRYVHHQRNAVAIVKSEDGMIDILPKLRPQIKKSEIVKQLESLRSLAKESAFDAKALGDVIWWLKEHDFYLSPEECNEINNLVIEVQVLKPGPVLFPVPQESLAPHADMNSSYFLPE